MNSYQETSFMLGEIKVSPSHNMLWMGEKSLKVQPKVMAVLHYLACNQNRVISNEELIEHLWEGRVVTHGSVQKSINALRNALTELNGDKEIITHYSKRGYQLKIAPEFLYAIEPAAAPHTKLFVNYKRWFGAVLLFASLLIAYYTINWSQVYLPIHHQIEFHNTQGYTNETGHERNPTPHPDNLHVAYIRERPINNQPDNIQSEIVLRSAEGKDWRITGSSGIWSTLSWSPAGDSLVAIEITRQKEGFFQPANHLYSFHIFTLDIAHQQLLEKQQLSQWQGKIFSVTWWDEHTLEIVAKQGPNAGNRRYHYSIKNQQLNLLDEIEGVANPIASAVLDKKTAIASLIQNKLRISFLNTAQKIITNTQLDITAADMSWIPDGSGVLLYSEDEHKLFAVYLNGDQVTIPLTDNKDKRLLHPHYSADGKSIFYTEEKRISNIFLSNLDSIKFQLTENTDFNYAASFSPSAEKIVYASVRNNQINLWLVEQGQETQLTQQSIPQKVGAIVWSNDEKYLLFNANNQLYLQNLSAGKTILLLEDDNYIEPIAYFPEKKELLAIKYSNDIRNLWRISENTQKQLTFGAVSSAIEFGGDVYFQYVGENGVWIWRSQDNQLEQVLVDIQAHSKLLEVDEDGIYFMQGGPCNESNVYYQEFTTSKKSVALIQKNASTSTTAFNSNKGLLQTECYIPEANIVLMK